MHHQGTSISESISQFREKASKCQWIDAALLCKEALASFNASPLESAEVNELLATCYFRGAFQSKDRDEFEERMRLSKAWYDEVSSLYQRAGSDGLLRRTEARRLFNDFWLERESDKRRELIERCVGLSLEAIDHLENKHDSIGVAEARKDLLGYYREALELATESRNLNHVFENCMEASKKAITEFRALANDDGLVDCLHIVLWLLSVMAQSILSPTKFQELAGETRGLEQEIKKVSKRLGTSYALCLAAEAAADIAFDLDGDYTKAFSLYEEASGCAQTAGDSLAIGRTLGAAAQVSEWLALGEENIEKRRQTLEKGIEHASKAIEALRIPFHTTYLSTSYHAYEACRIGLSTLVETDKGQKKAQLRRAIDAARKGTTFETGTRAWRQAAHGLSKALYFLAIIEQDLTEKTRLLEEALGIRMATVAAANSLHPNSWAQGVMLNYLALIKVETAGVEETGSKTSLFMSAISDMQRSLEICSKPATTPGLQRLLAQYWESYGDILVRFHSLTLEGETARRGVKAYENSVTLLTRIDSVGSVPSLKWKIARVHDSLGEYAEASRAFREAMEAYRTAAKRIKGAGTTFGELAEYMEAWAEIENARLHHSGEQYVQAHETYLRATKLLQATKSWTGLAMICKARSLLEKGEGLSHDEKPEAALESFRKGLDDFRRTREELGKMVGTAKDALERDEIEAWLKITQQREAYALGRIELEEARSLNKNGEKVLSSRKFSLAAASFRTLAEQIFIDQDRAEIETFAQFCESWARMKEAESKASPELFAEAAESFVKARETATNPRLRLLAMGDSSICRALESGTRFRQSRDVQLYSEIKRNLEIASDHYTEAGFKKTGTWTRATQRLFDALMLLAGAEVEREVGKKTELYHVAEQHLVLAAKLYGEAGFPSKKRETLEQLERTREEKEVLLAPLEALAEIPTASATHLPSITLRGAQPLGLERFEDAKVTGELRTPQTHLTTGSDFTVNIDIANVGKTPATLIKLEGIVPEGCEPVEKQSTPNLEGNSLDLKGKRLEYLKTHGVQVSFRPTRKGEFEHSPRVVYVDEKGNYKSTNLKPLYLTVREPGISEGLHAPPTVHLPQDIQFENERSRQVFSRLVKEFLDDYMTKRIVMERAGWRSLMDMIREVKIPRSALYGPGGRTGPVLAELERRGLVETRVFPKERGRGGEIKKLRVAYENTIVRRIVDRAVMENA